MSMKIVRILAVCLLAAGALGFTACAKKQAPPPPTTGFTK